MRRKSRAFYRKIARAVPMEIVPGEVLFEDDIWQVRYLRTDPESGISEVEADCSNGLKQVLKAWIDPFDRICQIMDQDVAGESWNEFRRRVERAMDPRSFYPR